MSYHLKNLGPGPTGDDVLTDPLLSVLLTQHERAALPRLALFWNYYRNPMEPPAAGLRGRPGSTTAHPHRAASGGRSYRLAQERGLPPRLTGSDHNPLLDDRARIQREVVIENDIAWRVHAMVDFLFSKPVRLVSQARDPALRERIQRVLDATWESSGGAALMQDMALLGHVYGYVDLAVRADDSKLPVGSSLFNLAARSNSPTPAAAPSRTDDQIALAAARHIRIEIIEPSRGIPLLAGSDYRLLDAYILRYERPLNTVENARADDTNTSRHARPFDDSARRASVIVTEILSPTWRQLYEDRGRGPRLIDEGENFVSPGRVPIVHIQNVSQPFRYDGLSEVEPLIPLQDELNTRLSDRACRVTMQSFKMYLAKGIEGFDKMPVGPGQTWTTDNPDAAIEAFGGDAASPSEESHIDEIREALDKASSLPPLATGVVRAKIGNLTSENALRLTLGGVLSRTNRKRLLYGRGIADASRLILDALDLAGILRARPEDRAVTVEWQDPLPRNENDALAAAKAKQELGVDREQTLAELGYGTGDTGVV